MWFGWFWDCKFAPLRVISKVSKLLSEKKDLVDHEGWTWEPVGNYQTKVMNHIPHICSTNIIMFLISLSTSTNFCINCTPSPPSTSHHPTSIQVSAVRRFWYSDLAHVSTRTFAWLPLNRSSCDGSVPLRNNIGLGVWVQLGGKKASFCLICQFLGWRNGTIWMIWNGSFGFFAL